MLASSYPFVDVMWTLVVFFAVAIWFCLLFMVWADLFRRDDMSGWAKVMWLLLTLLFPFVGVLVYVITQHEGMADRRSGPRPRYP